MHDILRETAAKHGFDESKGTLTLVCTPAEASAPSWYKDSTDPAQTPHYDAILSSLVLCTVHDEKHVLENVHSWLRPGGKFYFLEHAGDNPETWRGWTQIWFTPVWKYLGHGCHLDRDHLAMLKGIELDGKKLFADVDGRPIDPEEKEIQGMVGSAFR